MGPDERLVTVALAGSDGEAWGTLPPFLVRPQFWPEVGAVVRAVKERHALDILVLRLLTTQGGHAGGEVSYLAEVTAGPSAPTRPVPRDVAAAVGGDSEHRLWWARSGWLPDLETWMDDVLAAHGRRRTGPLRQRKTWNLSLVVTAATDGGDVWLKAVPPFLADEGGVIARVARVDPELVPTVLGHDAERRAVLMDHIPGEDQWGLGQSPADDDVIAAMVTRWVAVQAALVDDVEHALVLGAVDLTPAALVADVVDLAGRRTVREALTPAERAALDSLGRGLPDRLAAIDDCGLPVALVHGDLHPGNWRRSGGRLTLLDWGDVGVGNPVIDLRAFVERLPDPFVRDRTITVWADQWLERLPGADPVRAVELLRPVSELSAAVAYQRFLDHIEPTERVYHRGDPAARLRAALAAAEEPR